MHTQNRRFLLTSGLLLISLLAMFAGPGSAPHTQAAGGASTPAAPAFDDHHLQPKQIVGYFIQWGIYGGHDNFTVHDLDAVAGKLTEINYAFIGVQNGGCTSLDSWADYQDPYLPGPYANAPTDPTSTLYGNFGQLLALKQQHPNLKTVMSVGGYNDSGNFSAVASTPASRWAFAQSCVAFMKQYGFDGIDIDWEYPVAGGLTQGTPADKHNFTLLLQTLRLALAMQGARDGAPGHPNHYLLTIDGPAGYDKIANLEPAAIAQTVDWINLLTYDYHGSWETTTNFLAPICEPLSDPDRNPPPTGTGGKYNIDYTVRDYEGAGVPASKMVLGEPFYARSWQGVPPTNGGLYQHADSAQPAPLGPYDSPGSPSGVYDLYYMEKVAWIDPATGLPSAGSGYTRYWDPVARVPWLYNPHPGSQVDGIPIVPGHFISYEDAQSIAAKTDYAMANRLDGVMIWELSGDDRTNHTLLNTVYSHLSASPSGDAQSDERSCAAR
jgi:chitinase